MKKTIKTSVGKLKQMIKEESSRMNLKEDDTELKDALQDLKKYLPQLEEIFSKEIGQPVKVIPVIANNSIIVKPYKLKLDGVANSLFKEIRVDFDCRFYGDNFTLFPDLKCIDKSGKEHRIIIKDVVRWIAYPKQDKVVIKNKF